MSQPKKVDARPTPLKIRDAVAAVASAIVAVLLAVGAVDEAQIIAVVDHRLWAVFGSATLLAIGFGWLDRKFGVAVGAKLREVEQGIRDAREAARDLASVSHAAKTDGVVESQIGPDDPTPIRDVLPPRE